MSIPPSGVPPAVGALGAAVAAPGLPEAAEVVQVPPAGPEDDKAALDKAVQLLRMANGKLEKEYLLFRKTMFLKKKFRLDHAVVSRQQERVMEGPRLVSPPYLTRHRPDRAAAPEPAPTVRAQLRRAGQVTPAQAEQWKFMDPGHVQARCLDQASARQVRAVQEQATQLISMAAQNRLRVIIETLIHCSHRRSAAQHQALPQSASSAPGDSLAFLAIRDAKFQQEWGELSRNLGSDDVQRDGGVGEGFEGGGDGGSGGDISMGGSDESVGGDSRAEHSSSRRGGGRRGPRVVGLADMVFVLGADRPSRASGLLLRALHASSAPGASGAPGPGKRAPPQTQAHARTL